MKYKKIVRAISFGVVFCMLFITCEKVFFNRNEVNSVWEKIQNPKEDIDVLIMGNSHAYTSLDAKVMSQATGLDVELLGSSSQYMEQTLENLKVVLRYQTPKCIILEANAAYADSRENLQGDSIGLQLQNTDGIQNYWYKFQSVVQTYKTKDILTGMFQLVRPVNTWTRWGKFKTRNNYIKDYNGYRGTDTFALNEMDMFDLQEEYKERTRSGQNMELTEYNKKALQEFFSLTADNNIPVWLYKSPTTRTGYANYMLAVEEIAKEYDNVVYIDDFHTIMDDLELNQGSWYDTGHLNRMGAEKVTRYYTQLLSARLNTTVDWNNVYGYSGESVTETASGTYLYTMDNYEKDCLYQFKLYVDGQLVEVQDYSDKNSYETSYDVTTSNEAVIYCAMIPNEDAELGDKSENRIYLKLMMQNDCVIE